MSGEASSSTTLGSRTKAVNDDDDDIHDLFTATSGSSNSSWLDELQQEHGNDTSTVYTYTSSWSTNYTMSNLVGPGRLLGKLYSRAGSSLERGIGKLAYRAGLGSQAKAENLLQGTSKITSLMMSDDASKHEKACELLLRYSSSSDVGIQQMVFEEIVYQFCAYPIRLRDAFEKVFLKRKERADIVVFSRKRPGTEYSPVWLHHYKLVSRCLSTTQSPFMIAATKFGQEELNTMAFSKFEEMRSACSDTTDALLAASIMHKYWDTRGLNTYVKGRGFGDPTLLKFASAVIVQCEVELLLLTTPEQRVPGDLPPPPWTVLVFVETIWKVLRKVDPVDLDRVAEDDPQFALWAEVFKLHYIALTTFYNNEDNAKRIVFHLVPKTWKELCDECIPGSESSNFRERLRGMEDGHGPAIRKRFSLLEKCRVKSSKIGGRPEGQ